MLVNLFRSLAGKPAVAAELVPAADLPANASPAALKALRAAHQSLARDPAAAVDALSRARARQPGDALLAALHAVFLEHSGMAPEAAQAYAAAREAEARLPVEATVGHHFFVRGVHHVNAVQPQAATRCLHIAHCLLPNAAAPLEVHALACYLTGDTQGALAHFDAALERATPSERGPLQLNRLIDTLPQVGESREELDAARTWFEAELDRLLANPPAVDDPLFAIHRTPFFLCYQGRNDRATNVRLAELFLRASPGLGYVAPHVRAPRRHGGKPVVGFVSAYLGRHSVGVWYRDLVRMVIENERFEAVVFPYGDGVDPRLREAAEARNALVPLGKTLAEARAAIESRQPDVLLYTDVGMHSFIYFLAFSRLARLQALMIGHPCTSGIPSIDVFLSNVHQDAAGAQAHYSERLVRLPRIAVHVTPTVPPEAPLSRAALGWREDTRYYVCPMMLQKMHPDFDAALAAILRCDADGEVVLFADAGRPYWQRRLEKRFAQALPDVCERIVFRPFAKTHEFLSILLAADCVLDPFHFSGGVTTYIVLSLGVPLVTLPGEQFRSRMTAGIYAQAGVEDCVARSPEHFVELAVALAADPARRAALGQRICAAHPALFGTRDAVGDLEDWIERAAHGEEAGGTGRGRAG